MGFFNKYPYTDVHEVNLDWIIGEIKKLHQDWSDFRVVNSIRFYGIWDIRNGYPRWSLVSKDNKGYISVDIVPVGVDINNVDYWKPVADYSALLADMQERIVNLESNIEQIQIDIDNNKFYHVFVTPQMFGAVGDGEHDDYDALNAAIKYCKEHTVKTVFIPEGVYMIHANLSELEQAAIPVIELVDLQNIIICGEGKKSIIKCVNDVGKDVFQLNGVKNLTIKDIAITAVKTGAYPQGVNGISMTLGTSNITIDNVYVFDLPYYINTDDHFVDGGKAFTVQPAPGSPSCENITIRNCSCDNCMYGFDTDYDGISVVVDNIIVNNCIFNATYCGIQISGANGNHYSAKPLHIIITNNIIKAYRGIGIARAKGVIVADNTITIAGNEMPEELQIISAKTTGIALASVFLSNIVNNTINGDIYDSAIETIILDSYVNRCNINNNTMIGNSFRDLYGINAYNITYDIGTFSTIYSSICNNKIIYTDAAPFARVVNPILINDNNYCVGNI